MLRNLGMIVTLALSSALPLEPAASSASTSQPTPVLLVRRTAADEVAAGRDAYAARLALASLTSVDRARIRAAFDHASTRIEAQLNPLDLDMGDGDPLEELRDALAPWSATFDAAQGIARGQWRLTDLTVRVAARCSEARADEVCVPAVGGPHREEHGDLARRARFAAWPVSTLVRRELPSAAARERCAQILRERARSTGSHVAVVLTTDPVTPLDPETEESGRRLARMIAASQRDDGETSSIRTMLQPSDSDRSMTWLALGATEIAIVPRLSAMFDRDAVTREVDDAVRAAIETDRR